MTVTGPPAGTIGNRSPAGATPVAQVKTEACCGGVCDFRYARDTGSVVLGVGDLLAPGDDPAGQRVRPAGRRLRRPDGDGAVPESGPSLDAELRGLRVDDDRLGAVDVRAGV